jgi:hypothetical protein
VLSPGAAISAGQAVDPGGSVPRNRVSEPCWSSNADSATRIPGPTLVVAVASRDPRCYPTSGDLIGRPASTQDGDLENETHPGRHALGQQQRGAGVPQVVRADRAHTSSVAQIGEPAIHVARIDGGAELGREHEARIGPVASCRPLVGLAVSVRVRYLVVLVRLSWRVSCARARLIRLPGRAPLNDRRRSNAISRADS